MYQRDSISGMGLYNSWRVKNISLWHWYISQQLHSWVESSLNKSVGTTLFGMGLYNSWRVKNISLRPWYISQQWHSWVEISLHMSVGTTLFVMGLFYSWGDFETLLYFWTTIAELYKLRFKALPMIWHNRLNCIFSQFIFKFLVKFGPFSSVLFQ